MYEGGEAVDRGHEEAGDCREGWRNLNKGNTDAKFDHWELAAALALSVLAALRFYEKSLD